MAIVVPQIASGKLRVSVVSSRTRSAVLRFFARALCSLAILFAPAAPAAPAQGAPSAYPERPLRMLIGFTAGGTVDALARALVNQLEAQLGRTIVIDNRGG